MVAERGFTLVEVLVAGAIGLVVLTAATAVTIFAARVYRRERALAELRRSLARVQDALAADLRSAGRGLPSGARIDGAHELYPGALLLAQVDAIAFSADLPRPDSNLDGLARLADGQARAPPDALSLLDELNGACEVFLADFPCSTAAASPLLPPEGRGCGSDPASPSCPWGLRKYRPGESLLVVDGSGRWVEAQVGPGLWADDGARRYLRLEDPLPGGFPTRPTAGFVATPDRVLYRLSGDALERKQCWAAVGSGVTAAGLLGGGCALGRDDTGWEPLARDVALFELGYEADPGPLEPPLPEPARDRVRAVTVHLALRRELGGEALRVEGRSRVALRSRGEPW